MTASSAQHRPPTGHGRRAGQQQPPSRTRSQGRGLAIAALCLGICALVISNAGVSILIGLPGVVLGIVAAVRARGPEHPGRVMAVIGASLSGVAVLSAMGYALLALSTLAARASG